MIDNNDMDDTADQDQEVEEYSYLRLRSSPPVCDPRELETIVQFSLRYLFGELERISYGVSALRGDGQNNGSLLVKCKTRNLGQVRAALTMVKPPPYLESAKYRFDVLEVFSRTE